MTSTGQFDRKKNTSIGIDEMTNDLDTEISWLIVHYLPERCIYIYNKLVVSKLYTYFFSHISQGLR